MKQTCTNERTWFFICTFTNDSKLQILISNPKICQICSLIQKAKLAQNTNAQQTKLRRKREFRLAMQIGVMCTFVLSVQCCRDDYFINLIVTKIVFNLPTRQ